MPLMVHALLEHVPQISQANCPARRPANIHETLHIEVMNGRCCKHNNKLVQTCSPCFSTHSHTSKQYVVDDCSMVDHGHLHPPINWSTNKKHARPIIHPWQSDCNGRMWTWQITWNQHETVSSVTFKAGHQLQIFRYSHGWMQVFDWSKNIGYLLPFNGLEYVLPILLWVPFSHHRVTIFNESSV